jgi:hypothetical protein
VALRIAQLTRHKISSAFCQKIIYLNVGVARCIRTSEPDAHTLLTRWRTAKGWSLPEKKERPYTDALPSVCYTYFSGLKDFQDYVQTKKFVPCGAKNGLLPKKDRSSL